MTSYRSFLQSFFRDRKTIGAVAPTTRAVGQRMARLGGLEHARTVAEFGPGTGAITRELLAAMPPDARLIGFEVYAPFLEQLRADVPDPRFTVLGESAETIREVAAQQAEPGFDAIISSVPFSLIGPDGTRAILRAAAESLRPGGVMVALQYHPTYLAPFMRAQFTSVERKVYPWNIPPVLLLRARNHRLDG